MEDNSVVELQDTIIEPEFDHSERVFCPFPVVEFYPDSNVVAVEYVISVSNDGNVYPAAKSVTAFDSKCMNCTSDQQCTQKVLQYTFFTIKFQFSYIIN